MMPTGPLKAVELFRPSIRTTIADGLLTSLGDLTFPIIQRRVRDIVLVSEEAIFEAMRCLWEE